MLSRHYLQTTPTPLTRFDGWAGKTITVKKVNSETRAIESLNVRPVITAIHADFAMRVHIAQWTGPAGSYPGGWCLCAHRGKISRTKRVDGRMKQVCNHKT